MFIQPQEHQVIRSGTDVGWRGLGLEFFLSSFVKSCLLNHRHKHVTWRTGALLCWSMFVKATAYNHQLFVVEGEGSQMDVMVIRCPHSFGHIVHLTQKASPILHLSVNVATIYSFHLNPSPAPDEVLPPGAIPYPDSLSVLWDSPQKPNGIITHYTLYMDYTAVYQGTDTAFNITGKDEGLSMSSVNVICAQKSLLQCNVHAVMDVCFISGFHVFILE